jgi:hypothetical protein
MKKHFLSIVILMAFVFNAGARMKKEAASGYDYIKMERSTCYGTCPNYVIEMYANGLVRYTGRRFAKPDGTYEKNFGKTKVQTIFKELTEYRVDTCQKEYQNLISDIPGIYYTFKKGKTSKTINNAHFGPSFLKTIATDMDELIGTPGTGWKKTGTYTQPK